MRHGVRPSFVLCSALTAIVVFDSGAQCPPEGPIQNYTGAGSVACPCFVPNEQAGAVFDVPAGDYPIEVLTVGIGWGSQLGGALDRLEDAIAGLGRVYAATARSRDMIKPVMTPRRKCRWREWRHWSPCSTSSP